MSKTYFAQRFQYIYIYIYISGSNNPKGEDHESNRAKTERFHIKPIFTRENFHKSPRSLHMKP